MKKPLKPKTKPAAKAPELPEWLNETPSMKYTLEACPSNGGIEQSIEMTMEQYEYLKKKLAGMQGYEVPADA